MSAQSYTVRHRSRAYEGFLKVDLYDATVARKGHEVTVVREVHDHGHGAAVLPVDEARRTCLLVRQVRVPVHVAEGDGLMLEAAAGLIDDTDADPAAAARREAAEELRHHVHDMRHVSTFYTIPGLVTERISCFLARYGPHDRITTGFEADADEIIDVEEWSLADLWDAFCEGHLMDVKAIVCLQALRIERPDLFERD